MVNCVFQGKSLYVKSLVNASMKELKGEGFTAKTIRLSESHLRPEHIIQQFKSYEDKPTDTVPRIFHFDVPPVVSLSKQMQPDSFEFFLVLMLNHIPFQKSQFSPGLALL